MNARTLLDGLRVRGFRLRTVNGRLAVLPLAGLTEDDRTALRAEFAAHGRSGVLDLA